nr:uncharacterized protein I203_08552 [Kwoniella mangroviensis CBS 8507]OCF62373.1 hypothetical protein I203_08552 [Kwoniella mangroviensis CBS 8507]
MISQTRRWCFSPAQRAARYHSNSLTPAPSIASLTSPAPRPAPYLSNSLTPAPSIASLLEASPWRSTLKTPSRFSSPLNSAHSASGHVPPAGSTSSPLSSVLGTPSLSPASTRRSPQSLSPIGVSVNGLKISSSPLTPTRRSSSRVTNPVLYVYDDDADDDMLDHGQETEVYEEDGVGKELEEEDEEEEEEEIEDDAYWERKRAKEIEDAAQDGDHEPWSDGEDEEERSVMSDDGSYRWEPEEDESDQGGMDIDPEESDGRDGQGIMEDGAGRDDGGEDIDDDLWDLLGGDEDGEERGSIRASREDEATGEREGVDVPDRGWSPPVLEDVGVEWLESFVPELPFMGGFKKLVEHQEEGNDWLDELERKPTDVDRWELSISPEEYLNRFESSLANVQIVNRAPTRRLETSHGPDFSQYMYLAQATHQLWVHPRHRDVFIEKADKYQAIQKGRFREQASLGRAHLPTSVFVHCLIASGCTVIRLKAYGQKMPITDCFLSSEPAQVDHKYAKYNKWDIGVNFGSPYIWLFASATGRHNGFRHYRTMLPGSLDYGTVSIKATHKRRKFKLKIYPRIVHVIKSFDSHLQGSIPKTMYGVRNQVEKASRMIHNLSSKDDRALGGFRIEVEVSVTAPDLKEAHRLVEATPFLDPSYWLGQGEGPHCKHHLDAKLVTREAFLSNANWVYEQAQIRRVFQGAAADVPTPHQRQILVDILNALGWNSDHGSPTKSLSTDAWWIGGEEVVPTCFSLLSDKYQTDEQLDGLFGLVKRIMPNGRFPCQRDPDGPGHGYHRNSRHPFRIACGKTGCRHKLTGVKMLRWLTELVSAEVLELSNLGIEQGAIGGDEGLEDEDRTGPGDGTRQTSEPYAQ